VVAAIGEVTVAAATADGVGEAARIGAVEAIVEAATADEVVAASNRECPSTSVLPLLLP
jgi:hypothetical protein